MAIIKKRKDVLGIIDYLNKQVINNDFSFQIKKEYIKKKKEEKKNLIRNEYKEQEYSKGSIVKSYGNVVYSLTNSFTYEKFSSNSNKYFNINLLVDELVRFNKYKDNMENLKNKKVLVFFSQRIGLSYSLVIDIFSYLGIHVNLKCFFLPDSYVVYKLRNFFLKNKNLLDKHIREYMLNQIKNLIHLKTIKGMKLLNHDPIRGQRRRSNASTSKKNLLKY